MFDEITKALEDKYPGIDKKALKKGFKAVLANVASNTTFDIVASTQEDEPTYNFAADNLVLAHSYYKSGDVESALKQVMAAFTAEDCDDMCRALNEINKECDEKLVQSALHKGKVGDDEEDEDEDDCDETPDEDQVKVAIAKVLAEISDVGDEDEDSSAEEDEDSGEGDNEDDIGDDGDGEEDDEVMAALTDPTFGLPTSDTAIDTSMTPSLVNTDVSNLSVEGDPVYTHPEETPETLEELLESIPEDVPPQVMARVNIILKKEGHNKKTFRKIYNILNG